MWIIPKNLSIYHYAQDTRELISDSQKLSVQLEQSVMWRSKPSQSKTWYRRLKKDYSLQLLFSQTLKSSPGSSLIEGWIYSQVASLASHFQQLEEEKEVKTQDTCGRTSQTELNVWGDLPLFSWKMSRESSVPNSKGMTGQIQREHQFCYMSLESWKGWVTRQRQAYSQRVKLVRPINESEYLYLVSEMTSQKQVLVSSMNSLSLMNQTSNWATPRVYIETPNYEAWKKRKGEGKATSMPLGLQVEVQHGQLQEDKNSTGTNHQELQWATPMARDLKGSNRRTNQAQKFGASLPMHVENSLQNWATPTAMEGGKIGNNPNGNKGQRGLSNDPEVHRVWTTPPARDWKNASLRQEASARKTGQRRIDTMPDQVHLQENYRGKLNPRWVEMLMGLPIGWTMPSCTNPVIIEQMSLECLEMELFQIQQQKLSNIYGVNIKEELEKIKNKELLNGTHRNKACDSPT